MATENTGIPRSHTRQIFGGTPADEELAISGSNVIARLRSREGNIALFTHGHFGCALAARWIELPVIEGQHLLLSTASISTLGAHPTHPEVPVISVWNATAKSAPRLA